MRRSLRATWISWSAFEASRCLRRLSASRARRPRSDSSRSGISMSCVSIETTSRSTRRRTKVESGSKALWGWADEPPPSSPIVAASSSLRLLPSSGSGRQERLQLQAAELRGGRQGRQGSAQERELARAHRPRQQGSRVLRALESPQGRRREALQIQAVGGTLEGPYGITPNPGTGFTITPLGGSPSSDTSTLEVFIG